MKRSMFNGPVCILSVAGFVLGTAEARDPRPSLRDNDKGVVQAGGVDTNTARPEAPQPLEITTSIRDDGRLAIAGVVAFNRDDQGRAVIEVKKNGDFDTDPVLDISARMIELEDGRLVTAGILGVRDNGTSVILVVRDNPVDGGTIAGDPPAAINGCEGALDEQGRFICVIYVDICTSICEPQVIVGVTMCDCVPIE